MGGFKERAIFSTAFNTDTAICRLRLRAPSPSVDADPALVQFQKGDKEEDRVFTDKTAT